MKSAIVEYLIKTFLSLVGSITSEQWEKAKELVKTAATELATKPGLDRRQFVVDELKKLWSGLAPFLTNLLVDGAFAILRLKLQA